jgi:hypothetical protein
MKFLSILVPTLSAVLLGSFIQLYFNSKDLIIFSSENKLLLEELQKSERELEGVAHEIHLLKTEIQELCQERAIAIESTLSDFSDIKEKSDVLENSSYFWTYSLITLAIIGLGYVLYLRNSQVHDSFDQTLLKLQSYYHANPPSSSSTPHSIQTYDIHGNDLYFEILNDKGFAYTTVLFGQAKKAIDIAKLLEIETEMEALGPEFEHVTGEILKYERDITQGIDLVRRLQGEIDDTQSELFEKSNLAERLKVKVTTLQNQLTETGIDISVNDDGTLTEFINHMTQY